MEAARAYLDQKDFSSMARGLMGDSRYAPAAQCFDFLKHTVESGRLVVYFSWCHIVESLRYYDLSSPLWLKHCEIVDILSKGNCIVFPTLVRERELELFLSAQFGFKSEIPRNDYPYGKYADAVNVSEVSVGPFRESFKEAFLERLDRLGLSGRQKKMLLKKAQKKSFMAETLNQLSDQDYEGLILGTTSSSAPRGFIEDLRTVVDRKKFTDFVLGTPAQRKAILEQFLNHIFQFRRLVNVYGESMPQLKRVSGIAEGFLTKFGPIVETSQTLEKFFGKSAIDEDTFMQKLTHRFINSLRPQINKYARKYRFPAKEAEKILYDSRLRPIPSLYSNVIFAGEYVKKHKGTYERGRKPRESDLLDLYHLLCLPYVDVYLTDGFFAELAVNLAEKMFGTTVLRNLTALKAFLEEK